MIEYKIIKEHDLDYMNEVINHYSESGWTMVSPPVYYQSNGSAVKFFYCTMQKEHSKDIV